ncbi:MAG: arylesterase, partial [Halieaceae bacterium]
MIILRYLSQRLRVLVVVGLLIVDVATSATTHASTNTILVVGDSISAAYGMSMEEGWVALLQNKLQAKGADYA